MYDLVYERGAILKDWEDSLDPRMSSYPFCHLDWCCPENIFKSRSQFIINMERSREYFCKLLLNKLLQIGIFRYFVLPQEDHLLSITDGFEFEKFFLYFYRVVFLFRWGFSFVMTMSHDPFGQVLIVELEVNKLLYFVLEHQLPIICTFCSDHLRELWTTPSGLILIRHLPHFKLFIVDYFRWLQSF